jgi:hypothetical protein
VKKCLIYQPLGLGDIIWVQPIIDKMIERGFDVYYPINNLYHDMISKYIKKNKLYWCRESDDFPLKEFYGHTSSLDMGKDVYLALSYADRHILNCSVMASKYYYTNTTLSDWRENFNPARDYERENKLIECYGLNKDSIIVNENFGTNPISRTLPVVNKTGVHRMSMEQDRDNGFQLFDWIGALENAKEIHTVETSLCYLIDKFCHNTKLFMYEKRLQHEPNNYYNNVNLVYRNSAWNYEN